MTNKNKPQKPGDREQNKKKPSEKWSESDRHLLNGIILIMASAFGFCILIAVQLTVDGVEAPTGIVDYLRNICLLVSIEIILGVVIILLYRYCKSRPSFGVIETAFTLWLNKLRKQRALKNTHQIAPALQVFLYTVLRRNRDTLGIDPGPDCGSLSPNGRQTVYRNRIAYYIYELVVPAPPEQDISILKIMVNQLLSSELNNYGIANLPSQFTSLSSGKVFQSAYLDRMTYDDVRHILIFEILFVSSDTAADALTKALKRDKPKPAPSAPDIYDDEI